MKIKHIIYRYRGQFLLTLLLVLVEAGLLVLFPLFIGYAIDDALANEYTGSVYLGVLGLMSLMIGAGRRVFDSRFYAVVYKQLGIEVCAHEDNSTSTKSAHLNLLAEVVEFFEGSLPEIVNSSIGWIGALIIIATLNIKIFIGCVVIVLIILIVYGASEKRTIRFNANYNNELEKQVTILDSKRPLRLRSHINKLMKWNIRLSDLEAINFSIVWMFMMAFLVISIVMAIQEGVAEYGAIFALILYLFQFIESVSVMPFFYQQWLRLIEILKRLKEA